VHVDVDEARHDPRPGPLGLGELDRDYPPVLDHDPAGSHMVF
jgi:hypothetical protein